MPKAKKSAKGHLPKTAPKRTGKRGVGPLDPEEDFDQPVRKPRQARLPEMEDPAIEELEAKAEQYASIRDQRIALNAQEKPLKDGLLDLMKKNKKTHYHRDGVSIDIVTEKETVRVKIKKLADAE
jgi:hypothetical protein